ncbi:hypothetical protein [Aestuariicoccus sp. MJ-SS9]|uniref:hypothetical protein n=1 Tax=Aestuariicoccus sp. MJ-SS9 TaxID=3079855 RepID=UPI00290A0218|nr:hypothetical protein [Aestuariicoccus sp. MJ-SS9]MDU8912883.1 hypothetical protein [Aestuariicoccus sp. MJ-SS9]
MLLFVGVALVCHGLTVGITYRKVPVVSVTQVPGKDMLERLVVVDLGHRLWPIRTDDRLLRVRAGGTVCPMSRRILLRRWQSRSLALPGDYRNR